MSTYLLTSEYVSRGHPDKVADQISDAILDKYLSEDKNSKVACETLISPNLVVVAGEITSSAMVAIDPIVVNVLRTIGYNKDSGFNISDCKIIKNLSPQSKEINFAVTKGISNVVLGAGDQGMMFGYATGETPSFMPTSIFLARNFIDTLDFHRTDGDLSYLRPDAKSQVTLSYNNDGTIAGVNTVVISTQHDESVSLKGLCDDVKSFVIDSCINSLPNNLQTLFNDTKYLVNPAGLWTIGGPGADTGLTGRKIVVDNYGADCEIGGGAFSGKDPSKVDRSAAYAARYVAKNIVASGVSNKAKVQLAYVIGDPTPVSMMINTMGTSNISLTDYELSLAISEMFSFSVETIIDSFSLRNPIYYVTARDGHFGISPYRHNGTMFYPWEETSDAHMLEQLL